jgi:hypothetical protein
MTDIQANQLTLNGVEYVRADSVLAPVASGKRAVVVVDRGWIFAGDVTQENGRIYLDRALHVFSWPGGGFAAVISDPKKAKADLRPCSRVDIPEGAEVFRCPVSDNWGL